MSGKKPPKNSINKPTDIFISFSFKNLDTARYICKKIEEQGYTCWLAEPARDDISPGENWVTQITQGLRSSKIVLLLFSSDSNASRHVQNEIGMAFNEQLKILPLRIEGEKPRGVLEYYLIHAQWFDMMPPPPPLEKAKFNRLIEAIKNLLNDEQQDLKPLETQLSKSKKVPLLSSWVLRSSFSWFRRFCEFVPPLDGALWAYLVMFLIFFSPIAISHRIVGNNFPSTLTELFQLAYGTHFYYPDLNAILFDVILHPAAYATLVYFALIITSRENQFVLNSELGFISTRNIRLTKFWVNMTNLFFVKFLPIVMGVASFFYRRSVYIGYGMKEPLLFWASLAVALSIYVLVALSVNTCYIALLLKPIRSAELPDDKFLLSEQAGVLAKLTVVFIYVVLMFLVEVLVEWIVADANGVGYFDLIRLVIAIFGGLAILILSVKLLWLWISELGNVENSELISGAFRKVKTSNWLLLILPTLLITLTVKLWLQVY